MKGSIKSKRGLWWSDDWLSPLYIPFQIYPKLGGGQLVFEESMKTPRFFLSCYVFVSGLLAFGATFASVFGIYGRLTPGALIAYIATLVMWAATIKLELLWRRIGRARILMFDANTMTPQLYTVTITRKLKALDQLPAAPVVAIRSPVTFDNNRWTGHALYMRFSDSLFAFACEPTEEAIQGGVQRELEDLGIPVQVSAETLEDCFGYFANPFRRASRSR